MAVAGGWQDFLLLLRFLFFFGLTIFLAQWGARFLARRFGPGSGAGGRKGKIALLDALPLGPQRALYLVRAGRRIYLLGVGKDTVVSLGELSKEDLEGVPEVGAEGNGGVAEGFTRRVGLDNLLPSGGWVDEVRDRLRGLRELSRAGKPGRAPEGKDGH